MALPMLRVQGLEAGGRGHLTKVAERHAARAEPERSAEPSKPVPVVAPLQRMQAMCKLLGLSSAPDRGVSEDALLAARAHIRSGEVYLESAYADGIDGLLTAA